MKQKYIVEIDEYGTTCYYNEQGQLHRLDGPAIIRFNGDVAWYLNGKLHRLDGPAVIDSNGYKAWFNNGKRHRLDGPAIIWYDGYGEYWLEGNLYSKEEFLKIVNKSNVQEYTMEQLVEKLGNFKLIHSEKKKKEKSSFHFFFSRNFTIL